MTHTYATLDVSRTAFDEITQKLRAIGCGVLIVGQNIDFNGVILKCEPTKPTGPLIRPLYGPSSYPRID